MKRTIASRLALFTVIIIVASLILSGCGECKHDYAEGVCTLCGEPDPDYVPECVHSYEGGVCKLCGEECGHSFFSGVCTVCGEECEHLFSDGVCTVCGTEEPDPLPEDGGRSLYSDVVEKYKFLVLYKYMNEDLPPRDVNAPDYVVPLYYVAGQFDPTKSFGYAYRDIDGDGYVELLLVENSNRIYAIFTVRDGEVALVSTFQQGMGYLTADGTVFYNTKFFASGEQTALGSYICRLSGGELVGFSYGWFDNDNSPYTPGDVVYYRTDEDGNRTVLSYNEYRAIRDVYSYFWEAPTRLTKLCGLRVYSALADQQLTDKVADLSTFDGIIEAFAHIHANVTEGKWVRSKWIGGAYDNGMLFESDEDFEIYNSILGACVLAQSRERASFGYSRTDLDGDGSDELVLLSGEYHVLAVFAEVDGRAVLLDSFTDLRSAFIDGEGRIHVKQMLIPGESTDCEYYVFEVKDGRLTATLAIGELHGADGNVSEVYVLSADGKEEIDREEWEALLARYLVDIGEREYNEYTEEASGITFTELDTLAK